MYSTKEFQVLFLLYNVNTRGFSSNEATVNFVQRLVIIVIALMPLLSACQRFQEPKRHSCYTLEIVREKSVLE